MTTTTRTRLTRGSAKSARQRRSDGADDAPPATLAPTLEAENPAPTSAAPLPHPTGKLGVLIALLRRPEGADLSDMMDATGWQAHSVRGAMSGALKRRFGLTITSTKTDRVRTYRIEAGHDR